MHHNAREEDHLQQEGGHQGSLCPGTVTGVYVTREHVGTQRRLIDKGYTCKIIVRKSAGTRSRSGLKLAGRFATDMRTLIHPFRNANGRTGRLLMNHVLKCLGQHMIIVPGRLL
uniref:Fido domain-containing protein n=1 Tax=Globodera rostochiensis TaxID=31243 RepID=A0A914I1Y1_GLORO